MDRPLAVEFAVVAPYSGAWIETKVAKGKAANDMGARVGTFGQLFLPKRLLTSMTIIELLDVELN